jgi:Protein of unknown function (DUF3631)
MSAIFQPTEPNITTPIVLRPSMVRDDGSRLLDDLRAFVSRFVAFAEPEQADAVTLWIAHSHAVDAFDCTPRLSIQSAEKRSGKTRLMDLCGLLTRNAVSTASITSASLFRLVGAGPVTLLVDEIDTVFRARGTGAEDLRGLLNAGYLRGGSVTRAARRGRGVEHFSVFCPVALAGIGQLPDTVADRSIPIRMKRRADGEPVEKFRRREIEPDVNLLRECMTEWSEEHLDALAALRPDIPEELGDRAADYWEPLLAIADLAGGDWPERARHAAVRLSATPHETAMSPGVRLLEAIRIVLASKRESQIGSVELARAVNDTETWPGNDPINARELAARLRAYDIQPRLLRHGNEVFRGYRCEDFADALVRYLDHPVAM